jgi:type IV secretory pathway VirB9-like protein
MGIVGVAATTAVVAGTAGAVRHHQDQKYASKEAEAQAVQQAAYDQGAMEAQQAAAAQAAAAQAAAAAPAAPAGIDMAQLKQLGDLHAAGVLTDEEFAAAKAKLLG